MSRVSIRALLCESIILFVLVTACAMTTSAQERLPQPQQARTAVSVPARSASGILASPEEDYRIGPSDVLEIQVEDAPELSRTYRVTAAGTFLMPYLGRVKAQELTVEELTRFIQERLHGDYLKDPKVTIIVREYNSRSFFIQGSVRMPGVYQVEGKPSLLELITLAGGLADNHGSTAFIIRRLKSKEAEGEQSSQKKAESQTQGERVASAASSEAASESDPQATMPDAEPDSEYTLIRVNINGLLRGNFDQNMYIEPRDIINIPPIDVFFVAGEVHAPGSFPLKEGTTLRQAISLAQGTTFEAAKTRAIIFREDESGKRQEIAVDVNAVMTGKKEDVPIRANDIIIVPNSRSKTIGAALLRALGMGTLNRGVPIRY